MMQLFCVQHESDLNDLIDAGNRTRHWSTKEGKESTVPDAEQVFRTLGRTVRLGRLLQRKILEPLLPGEGYPPDKILIVSHL